MFGGGWNWLRTVCNGRLQLQQRRNFVYCCQKIN